MAEIILASASPRRMQLLKQIGLKFRIKPCSINENMAINNENPIETAKKLAYLKAEKVAESEKPESIVIGADTIVVYEGKILGKPVDKEDAFWILKKLSSKEHLVYTGYCIIRRSDKKVISGYEETKVKFRSITDEEIISYIETGEPMDKAGAYGIQNKGSIFVERIEGDYFNVVGLPIMKISYILKFEFNIDII